MPTVRHKAITLVETLIYLAVFGVLFAIVVAFMLTISEANRRSLIQNEMERNVLFLFNHLEDTFNRATSISAGTSVFADTNGVLHLVNGSEDYIYRLDSDRIEFDEDGTENFLTIDEVTVTDLQFDRVELADGTLVGVRLTAMLESDKFPEVTRSVESAFLLDF